MAEPESPAISRPADSGILAHRARAPTARTQHPDKGCGDRRRRCLCRHMPQDNLVCLPSISSLAVDRFLPAERAVATNYVPSRLGGAFNCLLSRIAGTLSLLYIRFQS